MKKTIKLSSILGILFCSFNTFAQDIPYTADAQSSFKKSNGYRAGKILDVQEKALGGSLGGLNPFTSCEVRMNVGELSDAVYARRTTQKNNSNEAAITFFQLLTKTESEKIQKVDNDEIEGTDIIRVNPWSFNVDKELCVKFKALIGNEVVVHYNQPYRNLGLQNPAATTTYRYMNMFPVNNKPFKPSYAEIEAGYINKMKSRTDSCPFFSTTCSGTMEGKILKISYKGKLINTWELQIVEGGTIGRVFTMSMSDKSRHIARWAVLAMVAGYDVRFYFETVTSSFLSYMNFDSYFKDSNRLIYAMELMPKTIKEESVVAEKTVPQEVLLDVDKKFNLDNYIWDKFVDVKRGKRSLREVEEEEAQKNRREIGLKAKSP